MDADGIDIDPGPEPIQEYIDTEITNPETSIDNTDGPKIEKRRKRIKTKRQGSCLDIILDIRAIVLASHDRSRRYGILLDRLHDCIILLILFISALTLVSVSAFAAFGTPRGYFFSPPQYTQVTNELMSGKSLIKHMYSGFSPHNGRFNFRIRLPFNCSWTGLLQDDFKIYVSVRAKQEGSDWQTVEGLQTNKRKLECEQSGLDTTELYQDDDGDDEVEASDVQWHQRYITASGPMCLPMTILHDNPSFSSYEVTVQIDAKEETLFNLGMINGYVESWYSMNSAKYTTFEWILRLVFSMISLFFFLFFAVTMIRSQKFGVWTTQQKWLALLLFELIFYHDPLYVADVYSGWYVFPILETILAMTFVFTFLLYLLIFFHSLFKHPKERTFFNFWMTKLLIILPMYVLTVGLFVASRLYDHADPSHDSIRDIEFFYYVEVADMILFLIYFVDLLYYFFKSIGNARRMRKRYSARFKIVGGLSFIVFISFIGLSVSYSVFRYDSPGFQFLVSHTLILMYFGWLTVFFLPSTIVDENRPKTSISKKKGKKKYKSLVDEEDEDNEGIVGNIGIDGVDIDGGNNNELEFDDEVDSFDTHVVIDDPIGGGGNIHERKRSGVAVLEELGERDGSSFHLDEIQPETPHSGGANQSDFDDQKQQEGESIELEDIKITKRNNNEAKSAEEAEKRAEEELQNVFEDQV